MSSSPMRLPQGNLEAVIDAIWAFLQVDRDDPETWYEAPVSRAGMLEMFHHQSLWDNRQHPRIFQAFADVWQQEELWVSMDRANMNPPARTPDWDYNGMFHWDIDTTMRPLPRMVQGVLYLTDTTAEQGGFQCAPGFHRQFHEWVKTQPADRNPRRPDPEGLEIRTISRTGGGFSDLGQYVAARQQPQPQHETAAGPVHHHVPAQRRGRTAVPHQSLAGTAAAARQSLSGRSA